MNDRDILRYDRATRVQTFGKENAADFTAGSLALEHFGNIDQLLPQIDDAKAGQKPARITKATLLDALNLDFKQIAKTARSIEAKSGETGFATPYAIPVLTELLTGTHADNLLRRLEDNDAPVADGGDSAEEKAAKAALRARFIAYELPEDFVADLRADRDALTAANSHNQGENQGGQENTALISQLLTQTALEVDQLDTLMSNKYARQPEKLHVWDRASRVERGPAKKKVVPAPPQG